MIRLSTTPVVGPPAASRERVSASWTARTVVSARSIIIGQPSQPPPAAAVPADQRIRAAGSVGAGRVLLRPAVACPELLDRVQDLPGQLDLLLPREQRRVADQDVEQQPLVRLRTGLGERLAIGEVHVHV